jgi:hypothetical protein
MVNVMEDAKAKGITIRCFVPTIAASMAFQLLLHCNERYTADRAFLLWHGVRVTLGGGFMSPGEEMTAAKAASLARDLEANDYIIRKELSAALTPDLTEDQILFHFRNETLHVGSTLAEMAPHFITSYPALPGTLEAIGAANAKHQSQQQERFRPGTLIYIWNGIVHQ